jgi:hypothetical protein
MTKSLALLLTTPIVWVSATGASAAQPTTVAEPPPEAQSASQETDQAVPAVEGQGAGSTAKKEAENGWVFISTPYLWASSSKTQLTTRQDENITVKDSFFDLLKDLKFALIGASEARHGRLVLLGDLMYVSLGTSANGHVGPIPLRADVKEKTLLVTGLVGYRAIDRGPMSLDLLVGGRLSGLKTDLELTGPFETRKRDFKKTHIGPVIASRFRAPLGGKWGAAVYGDLGGFGIESDLSWQLAGTVQYDLSKHWQLGGGWRHLYLRAEKRGFKFKEVLDGPIITVSYRM